MDVVMSVGLLKDNHVTGDYDFPISIHSGV